MLDCCNVEHEALPADETIAPIQFMIGNDPKSCAAHAECGEVAGECCPNDEGVMLECCNAKCSKHQACQEAGQEGFCCPSPDGVMLDCCKEDRAAAPAGDTIAPMQLMIGSDPKSCAAHAECGEVAGECCPNDEGVMLECCNAKCSKHQACQEAGQEGFCCPSQDGVMLDCCNEDEEQVAALAGDPIAPMQLMIGEDPKSCAAHAECGEVAGDCCPNDEGVMLECCNAKCSKHQACREAGQEGFCCPSQDGVMLDCCNGMRMAETVVI